VIIKLGAVGCLVAAGQSCARIDGFRVAAVDTTGAGDAFNAGLAVAVGEGIPLVEAAAFANAAGAISVTRNGAQASLPDRDDVSRLLGLAVTV
jgi:ribokinase